jgi:tight adherence protein B
VKTYKNRRARKKKDELLIEFKDAMQAVSAALLAGYSMENAWRDAERELEKQYGSEAQMVQKLRDINRAVGVSRPLEQMLMEFARESDCEDIMSFAEVFSFAKRSGGNYVAIMRTTTQKISDRMDVEREIQTVLSGKKLEGRVMDVMPVGILAYLNVTSRDFMSVLYGNPAGIAVMTVALLLCLLAIRLSEHLLDIRV